MLKFNNVLKKSLEVSSFDYEQLACMSIRVVIVYFIGISIVRYNKKLIGIRTPFNFILFVILGSVFASAIVDGKAFLHIIGSIFLIITLNSIVNKLAFRFQWIEQFIKGPSTELIKNGKINWKEMKAHAITKRELLNELASQSHTYDIDNVETAILENNGSLNFFFKK